MNTNIITITTMMPTAAAGTTMSKNIITIMTTMPIAAAGTTMSTNIITIMTMMPIAAAGTTMNTNIITITTMMPIAAAGMTIIMSMKNTNIITIMKNKNRRCSVLQRPAARQRFTAWKIWTARTAAQRLKAASMPWMACRMPC